MSGNAVTRWISIAVLYLLAAPIYLVRWILGTLRTIRKFAAVRAGEIVCPHCRNLNSLDALATCKRCGTTEFGSRLYCTNCRQTNRAFACEFCTATIKVL